MIEIVWTKKDFKEEVDRTYLEMKEYGWTMKQCKEAVKRTMRDEGIILEKKSKKSSK
jgi:hypothetical protein